MNIVLYGIPNCDSTKKAMQWFKNNKIEFSFHDYKKEGISKQKLEAWCNKLGWETILNKRGTTWRLLAATEQKKVINQQAAIKIMLANNSIIKRPLIEFKNNLLIGFNEVEYKNNFKSK
ncbi:MAG TPA: ArsC family reductase [Ferruginibacter sp.]|nr:ArsC family reductase [Ferruginibacter sp.]